MGKKLHFSDKEKYERWLRWNYEHNRKEMGDGKNSSIYIRGHRHKVDHKKKRR